MGADDPLVGLGQVLQGNAIIGHARRDTTISRPHGCGCPQASNAFSIVAVVATDTPISRFHRHGKSVSGHEGSWRPRWLQMRDQADRSSPPR
jgi:hypothetical protein